MELYIGFHFIAFWIKIKSIDRRVVLLYNEIKIYKIKKERR
jgi:hypothetical protein